MPFIYNLLLYIFLLFPITSYAAWFSDASGEDMKIFDINNSKSYNLFKDNFTTGIDRVYFKIESGLGSMRDVKYKAYNFTNENYSIPAEIRVGVRIPKNFNLEFFGSNLFNQDLKISLNKESLNYQFNIYAAGAAFSIYLWNYYDFMPYVGCGIGLYSKSAKIIDHTEIFKSEANLPKENSMHYRIISGIEYKVNENLSLFSEYKYQNFGYFKKQDLILNSISLGIIVN